MSHRNGNRNETSALFIQVVQPDGYPKSSVPMCFTKQAFCTLINSVGSRPPESGAMGFSPKDQMGFDIIEFDGNGTTDSGSAVYRPSVVWSEERQNHYLSLPEPEMHLWSGHLHSHPGDFGFPSGKSGKGMGDLGYVEEVFAMNEWMQWFFIPILTGTGTDSICVHPWVCRRGNPVDLFIADLRIYRNAVDFPKRQFNPAWEARIARESREAAQLAAQDEANEDHPEKEAENNRPLPEIESETAAQPGCPEPPKEQETMDESNKTEKANAQCVAPQSGNGNSIIQNAAGVVRSLSAGMHRHLPGNGDNGRRRAEEMAQYTKRLQGVVSPEFHNKTILAVGVGAGSYMVEKLVRLCPQTVKCCDFDIVETPNLSRTVYTMEDARNRRHKVDALKRRLLQVNPMVEVVTYPDNLVTMSMERLDELFAGVDLVFAGTDDFQAQALINEEAVFRGIPAVFIGIHAGADGGRIVWYVPGKTPCYRCVARERYESAEANGGQIANLPAASGSIFDCQLIDMIATKIGVAILEHDQNSAMGRFYQHMGRRNDVAVRCSPDYEWGQALWGAVLGDLPKNPKDYAQELNEQAFLAMDTIWLNGERDHQCPVCGETQQVIYQEEGVLNETH